MKKINSGINLFKLFSMFMIAQLHILRMGGIIGATEETAAYYHVFFYAECGVLRGKLLCSCQRISHVRQKDKAVKNSGTLA